MADSKRGLAKFADANPTNQQDLLAASITRLRGALVFWQPHDDPIRMLHCSTQIVQAFTTDIAAACVQDADGFVRFCCGIAGVPIRRLGARRLLHN